MRPVADAALEPPDIAQSGTSHARILDKKHAIAVGGKRRHDLLVPLPDEIPVNAGDTDNILILKRVHMLFHLVHKAFIPIQS